MAFIYAADVYCGDCGNDICARLKAAGTAPEDPDDETSYDSGDYPKSADDNEEADCPQHCGSGADCLNAHQLPDGSKIGQFLRNQLTTDGEKYVMRAIVDACCGRGGSVDVVKLWAEEYFQGSAPLCPESIRAVEALRMDSGKLQAFAFPGGYPIVYLTVDGADICPNCANGENRSDCHPAAFDPQWRLIGADINYENGDCYCEHCNAQIPAAYVDDDQEQEAAD